MAFEDLWIILIHGKTCGLLDVLQYISIYLSIYTHTLNDVI